MKISKVTEFLEKLAPKAHQESYDNSGLLVGNPKAEIDKILVSLDVTEAVVEEAVQKGCGLIVSHHPIIFGGLKSLTGATHVERTVLAAIKHDVALYAIHTNLDNQLQGVNRRIAEKLNIPNPRILAPKKGHLLKLVVFVPHENLEELREALFSAGAGKIGRYDECAFVLEGVGSFRGEEGTQPHVGEVGERHYEEESRLEVLLPEYRLNAVLKAMRQAHPYEEIAHDIYRLENYWQELGSGMYGDLTEPVYSLDYLQQIKEIFGGVVRYTALVHDRIERVAWCGGSGSFLLKDAKRVGAQLFITSDFKYHQFFDAEQNCIIADIGHYENEQFTKELLADRLKEKFPTFAVLLTETNTNPINYL